MIFSFDTTYLNKKNKSTLILLLNYFYYLCLLLLFIKKLPHGNSFRE